MSDSALMNIEKTAITKETIKKYICPKANDDELQMFIELCRHHKLNPFIKDAYLVKYSEKDAAQIITSESVFLKRLQTAPNFKGLKCGIILKDAKSGAIQEPEGEFYLDGDVLVGAWAEILIEGKDFSRVRVRLSDYDKNHSVWKTLKARMIVKCARVQAIRTAFPDEFQGMYSDAEEGVMHASAGNMKIAEIPEETKFIEQEQVETIKNLIERSPIQEEQVLKAMKITALSELPDTKFDDVVNRLNLRIEEANATST